MLKCFFSTVIFILFFFIPPSLAGTPGLKVGTTAPEINTTDIEGKPFSLKSTLKKGPVILVFYRGGWCPYCNLQLRSLQSEVVPHLEKYKATMVAISVDKTDEALKTKGKESLGMIVISDPKAVLLKQFNIINQVPESLVKKYKANYKIDLERSSGEKHHIIAIPTVFTINSSGKIVFAYANENYKVRAQVGDILTSLRNL